MSSGLIFKRLFAVSLVLLALFVWSCEDDGSSSDSEPKILIELDSRKLQSSGEFEFSIGSFIKDDYFILENGELDADQFADFWSGVAVRWGLRQKTADGAEESSPTETFWLQRSDNYSEDDTTGYLITAAEGEKQFFVLKPQDLNSYLPVELAGIPVEGLEVVTEAFQASQTAEGQFKATASIDLPADFSTDVAGPKIYWEEPTTGFVLNQDERDAARTLQLAPTLVPVGSDVTVAVSVEGAAPWVNEFTYEWQVLDAQGTKLDIQEEADQTSASFTFIAGNPGVNTVKVVVRDNAEGTAMAVRRFAVEAAPGGLRIVEPAGPQTLQLAGSKNPNMSFEAEVDDETGDERSQTINYTWKLYKKQTDGDDGLYIAAIGTGASLNYDFKSQEAGLYLVKVEAQDGHGQAAQPAADGANSVEVRLNAQPVASFTKPAVGNSGTATVGNAVDFAVTVSDEESIDGFTYQWDYQAPGATDWMAFAPAAISKDFTLETKDLAPGSYNVRVNVTDEHGGRAEATYSLALQGNNPPHNLRFDPVVTTVQDDEWLQLASLAADTEQTFHVLAEDENVAGLKYEWVINGENKGIRGSQATLKLHSPLGKDQKQIGNDPHKVLVMIAVTDDMGNSNSIHRTLFVNVAPKVEQITPAEISRTEYEFELSQFSDTEADPITAYKWQKRGPGENEFVDMAGDDAKTGSVTLAEGQHQVRAKIQDEHGGWSDWSQPLSVDIGANHAPTLKFTAGTVAQDTWFNLAADDTVRQTFSVVGSDEDKGDTLSYVWKVNDQEQQKGKDTANLILYSPKKSGQTQMVPNNPHKVVVEVMAIDNYGAASKPLTREYRVYLQPKLNGWDDNNTVASNEWFKVSNVNAGTPPQKFTVNVAAPFTNSNDLSYIWEVNGREQARTKVPTANLTLYSPLKSDQKQMVSTAPHKVRIEVKAYNGSSYSNTLKRELLVQALPPQPDDIELEISRSASGHHFCTFKLTGDSYSAGSVYYQISKFIEGSYQSIKSGIMSNTRSIRYEIRSSGDYEIMAGFAEKPADGSFEILKGPDKKLRFTLSD